MRLGPEVPESLNGVPWSREHSIPAINKRTVMEGSIVGARELGHIGLSPHAGEVAKPTRISSSKPLLARWNAVRPTRRPRDEQGC